jgi:hypothetical protein
MFRVSQVAGDQHGLAALPFDQRLNLVGVVMLFEVGNQDIGALARIGDRDCPAYAAVAPP